MIQDGESGLHDGLRVFRCSLPNARDSKIVFVRFRPRVSAMRALIVGRRFDDKLNLKKEK